MAPQVVTIVQGSNEFTLDGVTNDTTMEQLMQQCMAVADDTANGFKPASVNALMMLEADGFSEPFDDVMLITEQTASVIDAFAGVKCIRFVLPEAAQEEPALIFVQVVTQNGAELAPLELHEDSVDGLQAALAARFNDDSTVAKLQVPSPAGPGKFSSLPALNEMGGTAIGLLARVQELVPQMPPFMRPPAEVTSLEEVRVQLPAGLEDQAQASPTADAEAAAAAAKYQEEKAASLVKTINTSKSGAPKGADLHTVHKLCNDGVELTFAGVCMCAPQGALSLTVRVRCGSDGSGEAVRDGLLQLRPVHGHQLDRHV